MEPSQAPLRYKIVLGKFAVGKVNEKAGLLEFTIELPGLGRLICTGPKADVKEGDLLTLYTEILANAKPRSASVQ